VRQDDEIDVSKVNTLRLNVGCEDVWVVACVECSAQMARLAVMFCATKGGPNCLPRLNDAHKKYAPKRNDFVVKTSLSCRGKRIS
jgi:hypothetical protein